MTTRIRIPFLLAIASIGFLPAQASPQATNLASSAAPAPSSGALAAALPSLDDLRAPTSPAFVLLGIAPTTIERPTTPKALVASLLSTVEENEGLPQNYALSIAPYWLKSHPALPTSALFDAGLSGRTFLHTLSVSIATSQPDDEDGDGESGTEDLAGFDEPALGIGFRGLLVGGGSSKKMEEVRAKFQALSGLVNANLDCIIEEDDRQKAEKRLEARERRREEIRPEDEPPPPSPLCRAPRQERQDAIQNLSKEISDLTVQRVGFTLELAGGAAWVVPESRFDNKELQRWGVWLTPAYRWDNGGKPRWDLLGVARYLREEHSDEGDTFDFGSRLIWHPNEQAALSAEYVHRLRDGASAEDDEDTDRLVAILEYQISDSMHLFASYGEDFEEGSDEDTLVSTFGLKIGVGQTPRISPN